MQPRKFLIPVDSTLQKLLAQEDADRNEQITIEDQGPKVTTLFFATLVRNTILAD